MDEVHNIDVKGDSFVNSMFKNDVEIKNITSERGTTRTSSIIYRYCYDLNQDNPTGIVEKNNGFFV